MKCQDCRSGEDRDHALDFDATRPILFNADEQLVCDACNAPLVAIKVTTYIGNKYKSGPGGG